MMDLDVSSLLLTVSTCEHGWGFARDATRLNASSLSSRVG